VKKMEAPPKPEKKTKKARKNRKKVKPRDRQTTVPEQGDPNAELIDIERRIIEAKVFSLIFGYMREAVVEFEKRAKITFANELELQDFIYAMLRSLFGSIEFEDPTEKICGKSNRLDFVLKEHDVIVEVKYVRDKGHAKKVSEELAADYLRYMQSPYGRTIINYVYDPHKNIENQDLYRKDLARLMPEAHHYIQ
jgi:hypothetical protein